MELKKHIDQIFRKMMFLAALLLLVCLLAGSAQADVWQTDSTEESVTIQWDDPPESETAYVEDDPFAKFLYVSNFNAKTGYYDDIFFELRKEIPIGNVLSITVEWGQDGEWKDKKVLQSGIRSYTITGLSAYSAYDVKVTYKFMPNVDEKDEEYGKLYDSPLGQTVANTDAPKGTATSETLYSCNTYYASALGFCTYYISDGRDDSQGYKREWGEGKHICTINMDRNVTVKELLIEDGATLVLTGSGTLTVKNWIWRDQRLSPGYLKITDHVSVNAPAINIAGLEIDTAGSVVIKPSGLTDDGFLTVDGHMNTTGNGTYQAREAAGSLRIHHGRVIVTGSGKRTTVVSCGEFEMTGGTFTVRNGEIGLKTNGGNFYVSARDLESDLNISITASKAAVCFDALTDEYTRFQQGDLILDSPVALMTPAGGSAQTKENGDKYIVNAGGSIAAKVAISIDPEKADPIKAFVRRCYQLILGRDADDDGLQGWSDALKNKTAAASQIINGFVSSAEFTNRKLSAGESVDILYNTMMDRPADADGKAGWVDALSMGYNLQHIIAGFCGSDEFAGICEGFGIEPGTVDAGPVNPQDDEAIPDTPRGKIEAFVRRCYKLILGREPDAGGLKGWSDALESRTAAAAQIIDGFVRSDEFVNRNLSAGEAVDILYKTMLGREADAAGKAGWVDALAQGFTLQHIINGFCGSEEFTNICNTYGIIAGKVAVSGVMAKREAITPEGDEAEAPVIYQGYNSEFINEEKIKTFVEHCYVAVFGREGDAEGIANYTRAILDGKKTPKKVAYEFIFSPEFQNNLPGNEEFIRILYRLYFDREPGSEEPAGWIQMLENGTSLEDIVNGFAGSAEFKAIVNGMKE